MPARAFDSRASLPSPPACVQPARPIFLPTLRLPNDSFDLSAPVTTAQSPQRIAARPKPRHPRRKPTIHLTFFFPPFSFLFRGCAQRRKLHRSRHLSHTHIGGQGDVRLICLPCSSGDKCSRCTLAVLQRIWPSHVHCTHSNKAQRKGAEASRAFASRHCRSKRQKGDAFCEAIRIKGGVKRVLLPRPTPPPPMVDMPLSTT